MGVPVGKAVDPGVVHAGNHSWPRIVDGRSRLAFKPAGQTSQSVYGHCHFGGTSRTRWGFCGTGLLCKIGLGLYLYYVVFLEGQGGGGGALGRIRKG